MKTSKFTEEQIAFALKQAEVGTSVEKMCRKMGISTPRSTTGGRSTGAWPPRTAMVWGRRRAIK